MLGKIEYQIFDVRTNKPINKNTMLIIDTELNPLPEKVMNLVRKLKPQQSCEVIVKTPFGARSKELIMVMSAKKFKENKLRPVAGAVISLDGRQALIKSVNGSRVVVDMNHPLAGKDIKYIIKLIETAEQPKQRTELLLRFHDINADVTEENGRIVITQKPDNKDKDKLEKLYKVIKRYSGSKEIVFK